jgi:hypothetical protein
MKPLSNMNLKSPEDDKGKSDMLTIVTTFLSRGTSRYTKTRTQTKFNFNCI